MVEPAARPRVPTSSAPLRERRRPRWGRQAWRLFWAAVLVVVFVFPFYWVIVTSLSTSHQVLEFPPPFVPHWDWSNYVWAWRSAPWLQYFGNTIFIATATTFLVLVTSLFAGYAFGMLDFPGRQFLFVAFLGIMMIPQTVLLIPDYVVMSDIHWINTYWAQIVPWGASVFGIFLLRQFFLSLPQELWEAASLDGASRRRFLWQVAAPLAKPALVTIGLYVFLGSWNSFLWPYIMTIPPTTVLPVEVGLNAFLGTNGTNWTGLSAAVVFTTLPVMILFLLAQRQFLAGVSSASGGLKG